MRAADRLSLQATQHAASAGLRLQRGRSQELFRSSAARPAGSEPTSRAGHPDAGRTTRSGRRSGNAGQSDGGLDVEAIRRIREAEAVDGAERQPARRAQGQGRRARVPSRPSSGNRSASSGPEASPVSASRSGMNSALPLRPRLLLHLVGPGLPGAAIPGLGRQQVEGLADKSRSSSENSGRRPALAARCATNRRRRRACRDCREPRARRPRPGRR